MERIRKSWEARLPKKMHSRSQRGTSEKAWQCTEGSGKLTFYLFCKNFIRDNENMVNPFLPPLPQHFLSTSTPHFSLLFFFMCQGWRRTNDRVLGRKQRSAVKYHPVGAARPSLPCTHSRYGGLHMMKSIQRQLPKKRPALPGRGVASECATGHRPRWGQGVWSSWTFTKPLPASSTLVHCWPFLYKSHPFH